MERFDVKIIANYLPQYHRIPENDEWWGEGYTDWEAVKKARPVYDNQVQPRVPLNGNYYDLADPETIKWQAKLAKDYGIWGFGIYHYWFSSNQNLLTKPAYNLLANTSIDINYLFIWDNCSWVRSWSNVKTSNPWAPAFDEEKPNSLSEPEPGTLAELDYGDRSEWKAHFEYLLPFFKDPRYMRIEYKPVFAFMRAENETDTLTRMFDYWNELALENGLAGVVPLGRTRWPKRLFEHEFNYQPMTVNSFQDILMYGMSNRVNSVYPHLRKWDYDKAWRNVLDNARRCAKQQIFYSGFVDFDDTPRRGHQARILTGATPQKFEKYLSELLDISASQNKEYLFLTAWNEWGEGAYLEPDERVGYAYLEAVKSALCGLQA